MYTDSMRGRLWQMKAWAVRGLACLAVGALPWASAPVAAQTAAAGAPAGPAEEWIEAHRSHYTLFSRPGYEKDAEFARALLDSGDALMQKKYGVTLAGYHIDVHLYPDSDERASVSQASLRCCSKNGGLKTGSIAFLSPSAPVWKTYRGMTSLNLPKDENYQAKVLMSEYITVGHYAVQDSRTQPGGWKYYGAPHWFVQGLQEYDGIFHTTDTNREITAAALKAWAKAHPEAFACCEWGLQISDVYNGGAAFMWFLATEFGEDIHAKLLRDNAATFPAAFERETKPYSLPAVFEKFRAWVAK
jgi:hypothetical protein